ncbi:MAG: hypothetical protein PVH00_02830 [Gemmatimonadota bacterium]|jgi:hypothetical protein
MKRRDPIHRAAVGRTPTGLLILAIVAMGSGLSGCRRLGATDTALVDALPHLAAEPELRIGDRDDPNVGFSRVIGIDVGRDGRIYVEEAMVPEIRVYSPDGVLLDRIGRRGAGPGEFDGAPRFGVVGDTVWAVTNGPDRITLFRTDGTLLSARPVRGLRVPLPRGWGWVLPWVMRPDGRFIGHFARVGGSRGDPPPPPIDPEQPIPWPFVLFDPSGSVTDTIGWAPRPPPRMWRPPSQSDGGYRITEIGGRRMEVPMPPTTLARWETLSDGYVVIEEEFAETEDDGVFTVSRFAFSGDTVYSRALHYRPTRYSAAELDSIAARAARGEPGGGVSYSPMGGAPPPDWERIANSLRAEMQFPEFKLPIRSARVTSDGSVWLHLQNVVPTTAHWLLIDPGGRARGTLDLPSNIRILWSHDDVVWAVETDDLDVPWVVRITLHG